MRKKPERSPVLQAKSYRYSVYGLSLDACLELPELMPVAGPDLAPESPAQVRVQWGQVPGALEEARRSTARFQAKPEHLLLYAEGVGRVLVSHGREIQVELQPGAAMASVRSIILGPVLGAIMHQRGLLPLHASGIKFGDGCVIFCGRPGTGKSTLAGLFVQRGHPMQADDVCVLGENPAGSPLVYPGYPQLKLWGDALKAVGNLSAAFPPIQLFPERFAVRTEGFHGKPLPVQRIFILSPSEQDHVEVSPITGLNKYKTLRSQTYRRRFAAGLGIEASRFPLAQRVVERVPMHRVHWPRGQFLLNELADVLERISLQGE